jgi:hypothetical protein
MHKRTALLLITACAVLSIAAVFVSIIESRKESVALDELNPFGSVEDVTLPMQVWILFPPILFYPSTDDF